MNGATSHRNGVMNGNVSRLGWYTLGVAALVAAIVEPFAVSAMGAPASFGVAASTLTRTVAAIAAGLLLVRRLDHRIGKLLILLATTALVGEYIEGAVWAQPTPEQAIAWSQASILPWLLFFVVLVEILFAFPDGTVTGRLRAVSFVLYGVAAVGTAAWIFLNPEASYAYGPPQLHASQPNPLAVVDLRPVALAGQVLGDAAGVSLFVGAVVSIIRRYRESDSARRHQIKWFILAGTIAVLGLAIGGLIGALAPDALAGNRIAPLLWMVSISAVPVAIPIAIFKYRLYEIDIVIGKALVYGALAVFITAVYVGIVVGIGSLIGDRGSPALSGIAAAIVAVAFQPARRAAQRVANRIVYGERASPYEVLSEFSGRLDEAYSAEEVLPRIAELVASSTGAAEVRVWLRVGTELVPTASFPPDAPEMTPVPITGDALPIMDAFAVSHQGELLGAITVASSANDPMNPVKEKLVRDLASQAGLVLRNVRLIEELRASRRRIVTAQDERAQKLERNIHDGAQQQLVALSIKLRLADSMVDRDPANAHAMLSQLQSETTDVLDDLRDLARGIYPPLLADKGLAAALAAQARKSPVSVEIDAGSIGRYPQEAEAAVYFCVLEALQNVAKYARATAARIRLSSHDGDLKFEVADDGIGFAQNGPGAGTGLQGMLDRVEALGGTLDVRSAPGRGTVVSGRLPVGRTPQDDVAAAQADSSRSGPKTALGI